MGFIAESARNEPRWKERKQHIFTRRQARSMRPVLWRKRRWTNGLQRRRSGCISANQHAWLDETYRPRLQPIGRYQRVCPATRDRQFQDPGEPKPETVNIISIICIIQNKWYNANNNLFGICFGFENHFPENVVDQIHDILVHEIHFLYTPCLRGISAKCNTKVTSVTNNQRCGFGLHIHLSIQQLVKCRFISGMPYRHVKVLDKEGTHCFIQGEEKKKPAARFEIISIMLIKNTNNIITVKNIL